MVIKMDKNKDDKNETNNFDELPSKSVKRLITQQKGWLKTERNLADIDEPVLLLIRNSGKIEVKENVKSGIYRFTHSNGDEYKCYLDNQKLMTMKYSDDTIKCWLLYEDNFTAYPIEPINDIELLNAIFDKLSAEHEKWQAKKIENATQLLKTAGYVIIGGIAAYYFIQWFFNDPQNASQAAQQGANQVAQNLSNVTNSNSTSILG